MKGTPNPGQRKGYFLMKYSLDFKLECVIKYKNIEHIDNPPGTNRHVFLDQVRRWTKNFNDLGIDGLKSQYSIKIWTLEKRFELVAKVMAGNSISTTAEEAHINPGQLYQWMRRYNEKGIDGLKCKKGRPLKEFVINKKLNKKPKLTVSEKEELILLREKIQYLEMENEYLKKLDALVSKREAAEAKVKKLK